MAAESQSLRSKLQQVEKQAEAIIAAAKKNRLAKLKQAKEKAEEDLEAFRVEQDAKFKKEMATKAAADPSRELRGATEREVEAVKQDYGRNKAQAVQFVVSKVLEVMTTLTETQKLALSSKARRKSERAPSLPPADIEKASRSSSTSTMPTTPRPQSRCLEDQVESPMKAGMRKPPSQQEPKPLPEQEPTKPTHYTVVWHWGYPKNHDLPNEEHWKRGPEWFVCHLDSLDEARSIYDSINERLGHHENRASRAMFSPEGEIVGTWAFNANWAENLKMHKQLREKDWQPTEQDGIWH